MTKRLGRPPKYSDEEVLARAVELFWAQGFRGTSVRDIEQALDLRPGSLYARFESKEGLFVRALELYADRMDRDIAAVLENAPDPVTGIGRYCRMLAQAIAGRDAAVVRPACMIVRTLLEFAGEDDAIGMRAAELLDDVEARLSTAIARAQAAGQLSTAIPPRRLARLCQLQIMGLRVLAQRPLAPRVITQTADDVLRLLERLAAAPEPIRKAS